MTIRDFEEAICRAAEAFPDFEWRLTADTTRTWYWWEKYRVSTKTAAVVEKPYDYCEVACIYCPNRFHVRDRIYTVQCFSRLFMQEVPKHGLDRILKGMGLDVMLRIPDKTSGQPT